VSPELALTKKRAYGAKLVGGLLDPGKRGVIFATMVARSPKPEGTRLLRHLGFTRTPSTTEQKNVVLVVEMSDSKPAMLQKKQALLQIGYEEAEPFSFKTLIEQDPYADTTEHFSALQSRQHSQMFLNVWCEFR